MKEQNYLDILVGVFGHPAAENPTKAIMDAAFADLGLKRWQYLTIDVLPEALGDAVRGLKAFGMRGVNCTIPHKISVIPYLDELSEAARLIGAVNTIVNTDGCLFGDNTDGKGFMESLRENGIDPKGKKTVVLGAGGAARAICVELCLAGTEDVTVVSRPHGKAQGGSLMDLLARVCKRPRFVSWEGTYQVPGDTDILINATPAGLYPDVDAMPDLDVQTILPSMFVQDVIPNPAVTRFLREARARGAGWNTGAGMLINQAAVNTQMWTGRKPDKAVMLKALDEALS